MASDIQKTIDVAKSWLTLYSKPFGKKRLKKFYAELIESGNLCYDIGGGLGYRTETWLALGAQVVCIEPQSERLVYLERRIGANHNLRSIRKALGSEKRMTIMDINEEIPVGAGTLTEGVARAAISAKDNFSKNWNRQESTEIITFDEVIESHGLPDFCQINCKGYEVEILEGLTQPIRNIAFGYLTHAPNYALTCLTRLEALGDYEYKWAYQNETEFAASKWVTTTAMRTVLRGFHEHERSGDIYARLRQPMNFE